MSEQETTVAQPSNGSAADAAERGSGLVERTLANLSVAWRDVAAGAARTVGLSVPESAPDDSRALRRLMHECLEARGGEVSARGRAAELGRRYLELDADGRRRFLKLLAHEFACDPDRVAEAIGQVQAAVDDDHRLVAEAALRRVLVPPRVKILTQFNALPDGVKFLVDLRADLLQARGDDPYMRQLEGDLRELLTSWFDVGFLDLQQITWHSPAALLEKLIAYEAVHEIRDWNDLRNRLDSDRRCFALFHPRMPDEPLAFVEVALTAEMAASVQRLLDESAPEDDPKDAKAAIFYSITNTQRGLQGISFGEYLIKQVVNHLSHELPQIETFATLSPLPGFRTWLDTAPEATLDALVEDGERKTLTRLSGQDSCRAALQVLLARSEWPDDSSVAGALQGPLRRLAARYLLARRDNGAPIDPVARFHLKNGARLERINWLGDISAKGLRQAAGVMVNYRYDLDDIEANHEAYMRESRVVLGSDVQRLLKGWKDHDGKPLRRLA
ncbi:malonyl-CoA decarboxylase [Rhodovibrio salinarum]|uniref:Malonyl-CoA decarboxylase n=1 Tax=Rhodovibrio salinarum TaxID=1087 RepID=A0A934QJ94_9PROT|nr:malonyl-CoA decarboxylase [Rhodovibrio salinarum]MBK1697894.1 malonyl-CoA decarboxylase [Rhodovibrio salinarum]